MKKTFAFISKAATILAGRATAIQILLGLGLLGAGLWRLIHPAAALVAIGALLVLDAIMHRKGG